MNSGMINTGGKFKNIKMIKGHFFEHSILGTLLSSIEQNNGKLHKDIYIQLLAIGPLIFGVHF